MSKQSHCSILLLHRQGRAQAFPATRHLRLTEPFASDPLYSKGFPYDRETGYDYLSLEQYGGKLRDSLAFRYKKVGLELRAQTDLESVFPFTQLYIPIICVTSHCMPEARLSQISAWYSEVPLLALLPRSVYALNNAS